MRSVMSGNEAIARGAWEAGVTVATAYPGTPSTEILENVATYPDIYSEWSVNEKVAVEVAIGATEVGARCLSAMKVVGLNVAADPVFNASYVGTPGYVVVVADDPGRYSSQTEQDNRRLGPYAKIPVLEPATSQECKDFVRVGIELSERFRTPVMLRTTTRTSHSKGLVELGERTEKAEPLALIREPRYSLLPGLTRTRHQELEERMAGIRAWADETDINRIEMGDAEVGIVACGAAYQFAREAFPQASFLKVGMSYPLPEKLVREFRSKVQRLYVVEELDPFLEEQIRLMGVQVDGGAELLPRWGELDPYLVATGLTRAGVSGANPVFTVQPDAPVQGLPMRPPTLCPGCGHRGVFTVLSRLKVFGRRHWLLHLGHSAPLQRPALRYLHGGRGLHRPRHREGLGRSRPRKEKPQGLRHRRLHLLPLRYDRIAQHRVERRFFRGHHPRQPHHGHDRWSGDPGHGPYPVGRGGSGGGYGSAVSGAGSEQGTDGRCL